MEQWELTIYSESKYGKKLVHVFRVNTKPEAYRILNTVKFRKGTKIVYVKIDNQYYLC